MLTRSGELSLAYDGANGLLEQTRLSTLETTWTRNGFGEAVSRRTARSGSELYSVDYQRDTAGRIVRMSA